MFLSPEFAAHFAQNFPWPHAPWPRVEIKFIGETKVHGVAIPLFLCTITFPRSMVSVRSNSPEGALRFAIHALLNELEKAAGGACGCMMRARIEAQRIAN